MDNVWNYRCPLRLTSCALIANHLAGHGQRRDGWGELDDHGRDRPEKGAGEQQGKAACAPRGQSAFGVAIGLHAIRVYRGAMIVLIRMEHDCPGAWSLGDTHCLLSWLSACHPTR